MGIKEGDDLTIVCYKTSYNGLIEADGCFYVSHKTGGDENPDTDAPTYTLTDDGLPTAYSADEAIVTLGGIENYISNVANYGNGIQLKSGGSYIANKSALKKITKIKVTCSDGKTYYPGNVSLYVGTSAKPEGSAVEGADDDVSTTFDLSGGDYTFFTIKNASGYAVYFSKIEITCEE